MATAQISQLSSHSSGLNGTKRMRSNAAAAAALVAAAMNATTGVGAPWYTSGTQVWNGAAPSLNNSPTSTSTAPASMSPSRSLIWPIMYATSENDVVAVAP